MRVKCNYEQWKFIKIYKYDVDPFERIKHKFDKEKSKDGYISVTSTGNVTESIKLDKKYISFSEWVKKEGLLVNDNRIMVCKKVAKVGLEVERGRDIESAEDYAVGETGDGLGVIKNILSSVTYPIKVKWKGAISPREYRCKYKSNYDLYIANLYVEEGSDLDIDKPKELPFAGTQVFLQGSRNSEIQKRLFELGYIWKSGTKYTIPQASNKWCMLCTDGTLSYDSVGIKFNCPDTSLSKLFKEEDWSGLTSPNHLGSLGENKVLKKEDFYDTKIWIGDHPELRKIVIDKLYELGFSFENWVDRRLKFTSLYLHSDACLGYMCSETDADFFNAHEHKGIFTRDLGIKLPSRGSNPLEVFDLSATEWREYILNSIGIDCVKKEEIEPEKVKIYKAPKENKRKLIKVVVNI